MFTTKKVRNALIAVTAVGAALVSGGVASAATTGRDITPWTTTHSHVAMADDAGAGKVTIQPLLITRKFDKASVIFF
jgi:hypothetical protein